MKSTRDYMMDLLVQNIQNISLDYRIMSAAAESVADLLPPEIIEKQVSSFIRATKVSEKQKLEVLLLTYDAQILALNFTAEERDIFSGSIGGYTNIRLTTYHSTSSERFAVGQDVAPYRADLEIKLGDFRILQSAEGDRKLVSSLIKFGQKCSLAAREDIQVNYQYMRRFRGK